MNNILDTISRCDARIEELKAALADMTARAEALETALSHTSGVCRALSKERRDAIARAEKAEKAIAAMKSAYENVRGMLDRGGRDVLDMD